LRPLSAACAPAITAWSFGIVPGFEPSIHSDQPCGFRPSEGLSLPEGRSCRYRLIVRHLPPTRAGGSIRTTTAFFATSACALFGTAVCSTDIVRLFWLAQHCFQCLARCCSPVPPPAFAGYGFRRSGCDWPRVPGRNQSRSSYHTAETSSVFPCHSEEWQRSTASAPATLQLYDFHRLAAGPFPVRISRPCLASEQVFQLTLTQARLRDPTGVPHIHFLRSNS
jgi:hypothetical protein